MAPGKPEWRITAVSETRVPTFSHSNVLEKVINIDYLWVRGCFPTARPLGRRSWPAILLSSRALVVGATTKVSIQKPSWALAVSTIQHHELQLRSDRCCNVLMRGSAVGFPLESMLLILAAEDFTPKAVSTVVLMSVSRELGPPRGAKTSTKVTV